MFENFKRKRTIKNLARKLPKKLVALFGKKNTTLKGRLNEQPERLFVNIVSPVHRRTTWFSPTPCFAHLPSSTRFNMSLMRHVIIIRYEKKYRKCVLTILMGLVFQTLMRYRLTIAAFHRWAMVAASQMAEVVEAINYVSVYVKSHKL